MTFNLGVGEAYGYDYLFYEYYGTWEPIFSVYYRTSDYAYFYQYTWYNYDYYGLGLYYLTDIRGGYVQAY